MDWYLYWFLVKGFVLPSVAEQLCYVRCWWKQYYLHFKINDCKFKSLLPGQFLWKESLELEVIRKDSWYAVICQNSLISFQQFRAVLMFWGNEEILFIICDWKSCFKALAYICSWIRLINIHSEAKVVNTIYTN